MQQNAQQMINIRQFSLNQAPKDDGKKTSSKLDYESGFDDMLKQGAVSENQQKDFEKRREEKAESVKQSQDDLESKRMKSNQAKEQAFEDMLEGKTTNITEDMNLQ